MAESTSPSVYEVHGTASINGLDSALDRLARGRSPRLRRHRWDGDRRERPIAETPKP